MPYKKSELRFIMKPVSYLKISRINKQIKDFISIGFERNYSTFLSSSLVILETEEAEIFRIGS